MRYTICKALAKFMRLTLRSFSQLVLAVLVCQSAGIIGSLAVTAVSGQYALLAKPELAPPGWIFGPVWIALYTLMGIAAWLIYRQGPQKQQVRQALQIFGFQLLLNAVWTPIFFGLGDIFAAFLEICALWLAIVATIAAFARLSRPAAWLLIPYLGWVSFATYLNFAIWQLNS